jgi:transposase-like protein
MKGAVFMRTNAKADAEVKIQTAKLCLGGKMSQRDAARHAGVSKAVVQIWIKIYEAQGEMGLIDLQKNQVYSPKTKLSAVTDYLNGVGSLQSIAAKYGLRSKTQLQKWIKMYNNGEDFLRKISGGSRMTTSRKTTKDERIQIVKDCLENGCNYGETATKHNVSYQQVYGWVKRFKDLGESGLEDRRGKRKVDQEPRSEVEELKIKLAQTEHKLYMAEMERDLLKKVKELERKDLYRK